MTIKKTNVLMAALLAVATVLAAGLAILPGSVQDAQANPCAENAMSIAVLSEGDSEEVDSDRV